MKAAIAEDRKEVRGELDAICRSAVFAKAPALARLLTFLVDRELAGEGDRLRETFIGVEFFGRAPEYDPKIDSVVRVNATRLRARLAEYYDTAPDVRVCIVLPKGSYTPQYEVLEQAAGQVEPPVIAAGGDVKPIGSPARVVATSGKTIALAFGMGVLLAIAVTGAEWRLRHASAKLPFLAGKLNVVPLTAGSGFEEDPTFSPDGQHVIYAARREGEAGYSLYLKELGNLAPGRRLDTGGAGYHPAYSPDGSEVAFIQEETQGSYVKVLNLQTGAVRAVTHLPFYNGVTNVPLDEGLQVGPIWLAQGKEVVYSQQDTADGGSYLAAADVKTGHQRALTRDSGSAEVFDGQPALSPDGRSLAFLRKRGGSLEGLELLDLATLNMRPLVSGWGLTAGLAWDPGGRELVTVTRRDGAWTLWRVPLSGTPTPVSPPMPGSPNHPVFSPDGKSLALTTYDSTANLVRVLVGSKRQQETILFPSRQTHLGEAVSPDGQRIAFLSNRSGVSEIWLGNLGAGRNDEPTQLTHGLNCNMENAVAWSPDGTRLAASVHKKHYVVELIEVADGKITDLPVPGLEQATLFAPQWSGDGRSLIVSVQDTTHNGIYRVATQGAPRVQLLLAAQTDKAMLEERYGLYFQANTGAGLLHMPYANGLPSGPAKPIPGLERVKPDRDWTIQDGGLVYLDSAAGVYTLQRYDLATGKITALSGSIPRVSFFWGFSFVPQTRTLIYPRLRESSGTQIFLLTCPLCRTHP